MTTEPLALAAAAFSGVIIGSFLNVMIYRLPRESSVVVGRSKCPHCNSTIRWFDNVPVVSYLLLAGRCRQCRKRISYVYPVVELVSGGIALLAVYSFGVSLKALWIYVFLAVLLVITVIDWRHKIIPDVLSVGGVVFGWVGSIVCLDIGPIESLIGSLVGGGLLLAIAMLYRAIR